MRVLGLMSGTSLDGLDLALCRFHAPVSTGAAYTFEIIRAETLPYSTDWQTRLAQAPLLRGTELLALHINYGKWLGESVRAFADSLDPGLIPDYVASHGHTVFHDPDQGVTFQLGHGGALAHACGFPVCSDFRSGDVSLGGEGAPLVPLGDELLFPEHQGFLNLGGIANVSLPGSGKGFDIAPCNQVLNYLSSLLGASYDDQGAWASQGEIDPGLLQQLNALEYYQKPAPKSLGREWVEARIMPLLSHYLKSTRGPKFEEASPPSDIIKDLLCTFIEHISVQIRYAIQPYAPKNILLSGGGVLNRYLVSRIQEHLQKSGITAFPADPVLMEYKEALIFAFLGYLRVSGLPNIRRTYTGALKDQSAGALYLP